MPSSVRHIYRTLRAILFAAVIFVVTVYALAYMLVSMPAVQSRVRHMAEKELSALLSTKVEIGRVEILPFNEVRIHDAVVYEQDGRLPLAEIGRLGAGISMTDLLQGDIVVNYVELISAAVKVRRSAPDAPYNISFIIDAFKPKEKKKSENVDLKIHTIAIRRLSATYDLLYEPRRKEGFDPAHMGVTNFRADISLPRLDTSPFAIEARVRRIAMTLCGQLEITSLSFNGSFGPQRAGISDFSLSLPHSQITLGDLSMAYSGPEAMVDALRTARFPLRLAGNVTPSDLSLFLPLLAADDSQWSLDCEADADAGALRDLRVDLKNDRLGFAFSAEGDVFDFPDPSRMYGSLEASRVAVSPEAMGRLTALLNGGKKPSAQLLSDLSATAVDMSLSVSRARPDAAVRGMAEGSVISPLGNVTLAADGEMSARGGLSGALTVEGTGVALGRLASSDRFGDVDFNASLDLQHADLARGLKGLEGALDLYVASIATSEGEIAGLAATLEKNGSDIFLSADVEEGPILAKIEGMADIDEKTRSLLLTAGVTRLPLGLLGGRGALREGSVSGNVNVAVAGSGINDLTGIIAADALRLAAPERDPLTIDNFYLTSAIGADGERLLTLDSDVASGEISGEFRWEELPEMVSSLCHDILPACNPLAGRTLAEPETTSGSHIEAELSIHPLGSLADYLNLPLRPLTECSLSLSADMLSRSAHVVLNAPYVQQGRNKLLRDITLDARLAGGGMASVEASALLPTKKADLLLDVSAAAVGNSLQTRANFNPGRDSNFSGMVGIDGYVSSIGAPVISLNFVPSSMHLNGASWDIGSGSVVLRKDGINVSGVRVSHDNQFVAIDGVASSSPDDVLRATLNDIDLSYIFDVLNIDYVDFGGMATGKAEARAIFSKEPDIKTVGLKARDFAYGGSRVGDADLFGAFDLAEKKITIKADARDEGRRTLLADGAIWLGRDSIGFDFQADRMNTSFLGNFMTSFASDLKAVASGRCHLFGTFRDIDIEGKMKADTIGFRVNYTNVRYAGSDSVIMTPGHIRIPGIRIYDREGHSGMFSGELRHSFFRDIFFDFRLRNARDILCYDTHQTPEDFWWGTVYASGNVTLHGLPELITIDADVTTRRNTSFFFSLDDTEAAQEYNFLTFRDVTPREELPPAPEEPDFAQMFRRQVQEEELPGADLRLNLRVNVASTAAVTLIMDPASGDKITASGAGPMQLEYDSASDEPRIYGSYTIEEGKYNFSLQDVILRDFVIKEGSRISFNGDPMDAMLDIRAAYRVNTSLTDLDKSFAYDRDLNRTNVPVDAMLLVSGPLDHPDINFDIELPTLTEDVARKVRSIVSTNDLMSRQIIYLLALNRFYTPEYMDTSATGGEWASLASSTISSQLGNALSQLTDKVSLMPAFRSEKGDFSDMEVDLGLSSRLFNNRLIINGNFGYRDRTTSTTTFVGDFDVQYLLNKRGNLRLKAYNHFNDQNYYLRSALTTQGIGIEYRHDFSRLFGKARNAVRPPEPEPAERREEQPDSLASKDNSND